MTAAASLADDRRIEALWQHVCVHGALPDEVVPVQARAIRQVGRTDLPSGHAFLKVMTFPRAKDRLRYLLRSLPAAHEARMLRRVAAAGIPCPEVLAVRSARRLGLPCRSLLVLRALSGARGPLPDPVTYLGQCGELAGQLAAAGLWHPDLHPDNFVPLEDGRLAVLDLQSMRSVDPGSSRATLDMAARLLLESVAVPVAEGLEALVASGLVDRADVPAVERRAGVITLALLRRRVRRCWNSSTEFVRQGFLGGAEFRRRGALPAGRWRKGGAELVHAWLGQRQSELFDGQPPRIPAIRRKRLWLPGRNSVYFPASIADESGVVDEALRGFDRYRWLWRSGQDLDLETLRQLRARDPAGSSVAGPVSGS